jgi:predicted nucleic acid-binding Zn ribbon protein
MAYKLTITKKKEKYMEIKCENCGAITTVMVDQYNSIMNKKAKGETILCEGCVKEFTVKLIGKGGFTFKGPNSVGYKFPLTGSQLSGSQSGSAKIGNGSSYVGGTLVTAGPNKGSYTGGRVVTGTPVGSRSGGHIVASGPQSGAYVGGHVVTAAEVAAANRNTGSNWNNWNSGSNSGSNWNNRNSGSNWNNWNSGSNSGSNYYR